MSNDVPAIPGTAQTIRSLVLTGGGRPLAQLTDDQLRNIVMWLRAGKPNELIARTIKDHWGGCVNVAQSDLHHALYVFRERIFSQDIQLADEPELLFDPLAENASFVEELKKQLQAWFNKKDPSKAEFEHIDRLGRLLADTIANHASIQAKLGKLPKGNDSQETGKTVNIGECKIIYNAVNTPGMPDFLSGVSQAIEDSARKRKLPTGRK